MTDCFNYKSFSTILKQPSIKNCIHTFVFYCVVKDTSHNPHNHTVGLTATVSEDVINEALLGTAINSMHHQRHLKKLCGIV